MTELPVPVPSSNQAIVLKAGVAIDVGVELCCVHIVEGEQLRQFCCQLLDASLVVVSLRERCLQCGGRREVGSGW